MKTQLLRRNDRVPHGTKADVPFWSREQVSADQGGSYVLRQRSRLGIPMHRRLERGHVADMILRRRPVKPKTCRSPTASKDRTSDVSPAARSGKDKLALLSL